MTRSCPAPRALRGTRTVPALAIALLLLAAAPAFAVTGDLDGDGDVDRDDLQRILDARNTDAAPGDPRDLDGDGRITVLDARQLALLCTRPRCVVESLLVVAAADRTSGLPGTRFQLEAQRVQGDEAPAEWAWELGDGRVVFGRSVAVEYDQPGVYPVRLTATTDSGATAVADLGLVVFDPTRQAPSDLGLPDLLGDVDADGAVRLEDALRTAQHAAGLRLLGEEAAEQAADVDLDGDVTLQDARLLSEAVASGETVPTELLPASGSPGTVVRLIAPELLDITGRLEIEVGASAWVQTPVQLVRGHASFVVPFDPSVAGEPAVVPGPLVVRLKRDGVVVRTFELELVEPPAPPADPRLALRQMLAGYAGQVAALGQALDTWAAATGLHADDRDLLAAMITGVGGEVEARFAELDAALEEEGGEELARLLVALAEANGFLPVLSTAGPASTTAALTGNQVCDELLDPLCQFQQRTRDLAEANSWVGVGCDLGLAAGLIASLKTGGASLLAWAGICATVQTSVELALVVPSLVEDITPHLRFTATPARLQAGETAELEARVDLLKFVELCDQASEQGEKLLARRVAQRVLLGRNRFGALLRQVRRFNEAAYKELAGFIEAAVRKAVPEDRASQLLRRFAGAHCDLYGNGKNLPLPLDELLRGPTPAVGDLEITPGETTARYTCPSGGGPVRVEFEIFKSFCGKRLLADAAIACGSGGQVTITMGDNGSLNDDIFEVRVGGATVLTSSQAVRSISTTIDLPPGDHVVLMIGRAAPDGIGTYYIQFTGATVVGGDPLSGGDLTPGVVKTFTIRVE